MQSLIFCCLVATAFAGPQFYRNQYQQPLLQPSPSPSYYQQPKLAYQQPQYINKNYVPIVSESNELNLDGSFRYSYATGDGQQVQAEGVLRNAGTTGESEAIQGSYSYTAPDGTPIVTTYIADENGFRAEGAHIPTPPPIPEAILRSLAYNAAHEKYDNQYDRQYDRQYESKQYEPKQYVEPKPYVAPKPVYRPFQQQYKPYRPFN